MTDKKESKKIYFNSLGDEIDSIISRPDKEDIPSDIKLVIQKSYFSETLKNLDLLKDFEDFFKAINSKNYILADGIKRKIASQITEFERQTYSLDDPEIRQLYINKIYTSNFLLDLNTNTENIRLLNTIEDTEKWIKRLTYLIILFELFRILSENFAFIKGSLAFIFK